MTQTTKMIDAILKYWTRECWRDEDFDKWIKEKRIKLEKASIKDIQQEYDSLGEEI